MQTPTELAVPLASGGTVTALVYEAVAGRASAALVLAHGAGAGQRSPFMTGFAKALASLGVDAITFNFPYTEQRRRLPDRRPALEACYRSVVHTVERQVKNAAGRLFIGGKSMGGRIATEIAAADTDLPVSGLVLLGYPLHPPGRPAVLRAAHLPGVHRPMLHPGRPRHLRHTRRARPDPDIALPSGDASRCRRRRSFVQGGAGEPAGAGGGHGRCAARCRRMDSTDYGVCRFRNAPASALKAGVHSCPAVQDDRAHVHSGPHTRPFHRQGYSLRRPVLYRTVSARDVRYPARSKLRSTLQEPGTLNCRAQTICCFPNVYGEAEAARIQMAGDTGYHAGSRCRTSAFDGSR